MLLHIASANIKEVFSDFLETRNIYADFVDMDEIPSFKAFFAGNKMLNNYRYIFFHFEETPCCDDLREGIGFIQRYFKARIIIFAPKSHEVDSLFGSLYEKGIRNLVKTDPATDYLKELEESLSPNGKSYIQTSNIFTEGLAQKARSLVRPKLELQEGQSIKIALAGSQARVGTTTQAFALFHALVDWGLSPVIVDRSQVVISNLLKMYPDDCVQQQGTMVIQDIAFSHELLSDTGHNAFIFDCGILDNDSIYEYSSCNIRLLCSGSKPWELPYLASALQNYTVDASILLFSFASQREVESVSELLEGGPPAVFPPWNSDIWSKGNMEWYQNNLLPVIKEMITAGGSQ